MNNLFYRVDENSNAVILYIDSGEAVTTIETMPAIYPVDSDLSTNYEHPEGIILTIRDAKRLGIIGE